MLPEMERTLIFLDEILDRKGFVNRHPRSKRAGFAVKRVIYVSDETKREKKKISTLGRDQV